MRKNDSFIQISFGFMFMPHGSQMAEHSYTLFTSSPCSLLVTLEGQVREWRGGDYWDPLSCGIGEFLVPSFVLGCANSEQWNTFVHGAWFCQNPGLEGKAVQRILVQKHKCSKVANFHLQHGLLSYKEMSWQVWDSWQAQEEAFSCMGSIYCPHFLQRNNCGWVWF